MGGDISNERRILIICFHYPPIQGGSGVHRMLSYSKYLPEMGWDVKVLTVTPNAYGVTNFINMREVPEDIEVIRAPALDAARQLSFKGRYWRGMALPDRWQSWIPTGILKGIYIVKKWRPTAILSTFPIASAHAIALSLNLIFNIPWVADFRDPMAMVDYPDDSKVRKIYWWLENEVVSRAKHITVTTPGTKKLYCARYGNDIKGKISVIENGFDENLFPENSIKKNVKKNKPLKILHSGLVYSYERDPSQLFEALSELRAEGKITSKEVKFIFRASGYSEEFKKRFSHFNLGELVQFKDDHIPYKEAISEMLDSDALMVLQGSVCNIQIPAKVYEYIGASKPIIAFTDPMGDTAKLMESIGVRDVMEIDCKKSIKETLPHVITKINTSQVMINRNNQNILLSRRYRTKEFISVLEKL